MSTGQEIAETTGIKKTDVERNRFAVGVAAVMVADLDSAAILFD